MTPTQPSQVEAAAKLIYESWKDTPGYRPWPEDGGNSLKQEEARRIARQVAELARPEVAAEVTNEQADAIANACFTQIHATGYNGGMGGLQWDRALVRAAIAASRVPVVRAEPVTDAMVEAYLTANDAYWARTDAGIPTDPSRWRQGTPKEATREGLSAALALLTAPPSTAPAQPKDPAAEQGGW